jgi:uncharacterized protein YuzE
VTAVDASYTKLRDGEIRRTIAVRDDVMFDLDLNGRPVGVEVLGNADWRDALVALLMAGEVRLVHGIES